MIKKRTKKIAALAFLVGFLLIASVLRYAGVMEVAAALRNIVEVKYLVYALVMYVGTVLSSAARWDYIMGKPREHTKFSHLVLLTITGTFVNQVTPGPRSGGEPVKAYLLTRLDPKMKKRVALASSVADGYVLMVVFFALCIITAMTVLTLWRLPPILYYGLWGGLIFMLLLGGLATVVVFFKKFGTKTIMGILNWILPRLYGLDFMKGMREKYESYDELQKMTKDIVHEFFDHLDKIANNPRILFPSVLMAYVTYAFIVAQLYCVFMAFGVRLPVLIVISLAILPELIGLISWMPGGFGATEASFVLLLEMIGYPVASATAVMIVNRFIAYWLTIILGFICTSFAWHRILKISKKELWENF